ncbi:uncharacterized protein N7496_004842 [Penicillium cataractarum]|uniref:penicillopepsin n=1 Tax=Penicillium cataractarum TaxID=2100454 RepID=A0A9W9SF34_9EURO|nr:uncharacterized protein N7496_004842 [Penicillium cataractarum]KAJ5377433.1 hypothetical protein N7496_004842 [Penicillium cataractarum]
MAWWDVTCPSSLTKLFLIASCVLLASVTAEPNVVSLPLHRSQRRSIVKRSHATASLENDYIDGLFWVNATVGTPGQLVQLQIDTGSSDIWVFGARSCTESESGCLGGFYDGSQSKTGRVIDRGGFSISYVDNSGVIGDYVADNFAIGDITVKGMTLAVATEVQDATTGVMGIGFDSGESIVGSGGKPYKNLVGMMVEQGLINSRTYSLWLNDVGAETGNILFGGYDKGKFKGDLIAMPIQPDAQSGQITSMTVAWTSLSITDPTQGTQTLTSSSFALPAVLDSGTTLTYIPPDLYNELASFANVMSFEGMDTGLVECEAMQQYKGTLDFGFVGSGGPVISVPFSELSYPYTDETGNPLSFDNGNTACYFGLAPTQDDTLILFGDTFLRSAYVVYDLDREEIAIAPTVFNSDVTNIVEIGGPGSSATPTWHVASSVSVVQTATGRPEEPGLFASVTFTGHLSYTHTATGFHIPTPSQSGGSGQSPKSSKGAATFASSSGILPNMLVCAASALIGATLVFAQ